MSERATTVIVLALLLIGMLTLAFNIQPAKAEPKTIYVDDDNTAGPWDGTKEHPYQNITSGLEHAVAGDTIYVYNGTYYENVGVNKAVSLVGENRETTIVDGNGTVYVVTVSADDVRIVDFTIQNGKNGIYHDVGGNCKFSDNVIKDNIWNGIMVYYGHNDNITNNILLNNYRGVILCYASSSNHVENNTMLTNNVGIDIDGEGHTVSKNIVSNNTWGISVKNERISTTILRNNVMNGNRYGFEIDPQKPFPDVDTSNTVDGKPVYLLVNEKNLVIDPSTFPKIGYLGLLNCTNITIRDINLTGNGQGILLSCGTKQCLVENVTISRNLRGIECSDSADYNVFRDSVISKNEIGVYLYFHCLDAIINNRISNNDIAIAMSHVFTIIITRNTILNNSCGISWTEASPVVWHNNFINNTKQASYTLGMLPGAPVWDDGYPSSGNYWSDYNGTDFYHGPYQNETGPDGIGDSYYVINETNQDRYPLMNPWTPTETSVKVKGKDYPVTIVSNTTIGKIVATENNLHFKSSGQTGEKGYILVIFPMVNTTEIKVFIDGNKLTPPPFPIINTNGTHYFIYFEFTLSTHTIIIQFAPRSVGGICVPVNKLELLAPYIALTILLAVAATTVVYVKKRKRKTRINS